MHAAEKMAEKLQQKIPRQLFEVPIQACIGGKIIARETVKAVRKMCLPNVMAVILAVNGNCWKNKKKVKKRMRQLGTVEVPQDAFMSVLKLDE